MTRRKIVITAEDYSRLKDLLSSRAIRGMVPTDRLDDLVAELDRARVVSEDKMPAGVVRMNCTVTLGDLDTGETETYTLVYPDRADIANNLLSVIAPIGTAILGYRVGDTLRWRVPAGWRRLKVEEVVLPPDRDSVAIGRRGNPVLF